MAKIERRDVQIDKLIPTERPKAPWNQEEGHKLWEKSEHDGHRRLVLKCQPCGLEYAVFTWRNESKDDLAKHFKHCPECGSVDSSIVIVPDHDIGRIYDAHRSD